MTNELIAISAPELGGGIGRNIVNLSRAFIERGYRVHLVLDKPIGEYRTLIPDVIDVEILRTSHPLSGLPQMAAYLLRHRPQVVLTPVARHTELVLKARTLSRAPARVFARIHDTYGVALQRVDPKKASRRIAKLRRLYPRCDGIIAVSHGVAQDFSQLTGIPLPSITVIYNPVVTRELEQLSRQPLDHPWFQDREVPTIISVARLDPQKNLPLLVDAFNRVRSLKPCRLVLIGEGQERQRLQEMAVRSPHSEDIALLGAKENPFPYMRSASLLVLSSNHEGFGNVLVEAMAVGTPVVSTDCPSGPSEILAEGRYGPLVPMNDPEALATAMINSLATPLAEQALRKRAQDFAVDICASTFLKTFGF